MATALRRLRRQRLSRDFGANCSSLATSRRTRTTSFDHTEWSGGDRPIETASAQNYANYEARDTRAVASDFKRGSH